MPEPESVPGALSSPPASADLRWREAAVLGSLWAASEIVLGSFLHNLKVPLRGHIMTAIGVILLVAGHRRWPQRGLIWRAGLIAAAMLYISLILTFGSVAMGIGIMALNIPDVGSVVCVG